MAATETVTMTDPSNDEPLSFSDHAREVWQLFMAWCCTSLAVPVAPNDYRSRISAYWRFQWTRCTRLGGLPHYVELGLVELVTIGVVARFRLFRWIMTLVALYGVRTVYQYRSAPPSASSEASREADGENDSRMSAWFVHVVGCIAWTMTVADLYHQLGGLPPVGSLVSIIVWVGTALYVADLFVGCVMAVAERTRRYHAVAHYRYAAARRARQSFVAWVHTGYVLAVVPYAMLLSLNTSSTIGGLVVAWCRLVVTLAAHAGESHRNAHIGNGETCGDLVVWLQQHLVWLPPSRHLTHHDDEQLLHPDHGYALLTGWSNPAVHWLLDHYERWDTLRQKKKGAKKAESGTDKTAATTTATTTVDSMPSMPSSTPYDPSVPIWAPDPPRSSVIVTSDRSD